MYANYRKRIVKRPYRKNYRNNRYKKVNTLVQQKMVIPRNIGSNLSHSFKRHIDLDVILLSGTTNYYGSYTFNMNLLPGSTDFSNLYDMYKLNLVKISFIPIFNMFANTVKGSGTDEDTLFYNTRFASAIDYNDVLLPTSLNDLREYQTCKVTPVNKTHKRLIRPMYKSTVDGGTAPKRGYVNSITTNHYGLKIAIESPNQTDSTTPQSFRWRVEAVYYFTCKNPK